MPYTQLNEKLVFVKLEPFKSVYGTWKEDKDKKFIYIRRTDYSSLITGEWGKLTKNFTENQDWYIPIQGQREFNWNNCALTVKPEESDRPWLSWIFTPVGQQYLVKTRLSASGMMNYGSAVMASLNPVTAFGSAGWWFIQKQRFKYSLSENRGERSPSMMPKVLARKCWFVDIEKYKPYEYANHMLTNNLL